MTDRFEEIVEDLKNWRGLTTEYAEEHTHWLVAEVTRLRHILEMTERALVNTTIELGLIDDDD